MIPRALSVGELIAGLGWPAYIDFTLVYDPLGRESLAFRLFYPAQRLIAQGSMLAAAQSLRPDAPIDRLTYPTEPFGRPVLALDWQGLGPMTKYYPGWE